jgi:hypothetical protein
MFFMALSSGLYTTLIPSTNHAKWITFLVFQGLGAVSMQSPLLAVQAALASRPQYIPVGISIVAFFQYFGAAVFQSIALAVFQNRLVSGLKHAGLSPAQVQLLLDAGSGHARRATEEAFPNKLGEVVAVYNVAITRVFVSLSPAVLGHLASCRATPLIRVQYVPLTSAILAFISALGIEWKDIRAAKKTAPKAEGEVKGVRETRPVPGTAVEEQIVPSSKDEEDAGPR